MDISQQLRLKLNDPSIEIVEQVQSLWSGYGQVIRIKSKQHQRCYVVKVVAPPLIVDHPRGWHSDVGHQRKLKSYQVEACFYQRFAIKTGKQNRVPKLVSSFTEQEFTFLVMDDLDEFGYIVRYEKADWSAFERVVKWLAYFHAQFLHQDADTLWPIGSYWHLQTRRDEWQAMPDCPFKRKAKALDDMLNQAKFKTLVHGDAKFANMCFHQNGIDVSAVDFQYVGKGSGMKDLAYLAGSCFSNEQLYQYDNKVVKTYLKYFHQAIIALDKTCDLDAFDEESFQLYPVAWADFYRFLLGWNPNSWKICPFLIDKAEQGILNLNDENNE